MTVPTPYGRVARLVYIIRLAENIADARADLHTQIRDALDEGVPVAQIARAAGMSRQHIYDLRRKWADQ